MRFIFDTARVAARSTGTFANIRTFIVGVFVIPLLGVAFNVLLGHGIGAPDVRAIALASLSIGVLGIAASTFVAIVVHDRTLGIIDEVFFRPGHSWKYLIGIAIPAFGTALLTGCVLFLLVGGFHPLAMLRLVLPAALCGICFGVAAAGVGLAKGNPYFLLNWVIAFLPLTTGAVVPLSYYPEVMRYLPLSAVVQSWRENTPLSLVDATYNAGFFILIAVLGFFATKRYVAAIRSGTQFHAL